MCLLHNVSCISGFGCFNNLFVLCFGEFKSAAANLGEMLGHVRGVLAPWGLLPQGLGHSAGETRHVAAAQPDDLDTQRLALLAELGYLVSAAQPRF